VRAAAARLAAGRVRAVDLAEVNGRLFCTVGGIGLIARTTRTVAGLGAPGSPVRAIARGLGSQAYLVVAAFQILACATTDAVSIEASGPDGPFTWQGRCHAVLIASQPTLGAGLAVPVASSDTDALAELCIVPARHRLSLARHLVALKTGTPVPEAVLRVRRIASAVLRTDGLVPCTADGEWVGDADRFEIRVRPASLQVLV
jgi:diacylglycerol kinase family enzyme